MNTEFTLLVEFEDEGSEQIDWGKVKTDLRERAAMQGFCANPEFDDASPKQIAELSVAHADALIAELQKGVQQ